MKILCDFHHSSLLKSLRLLFEEHLGHELYRPIGMEWFEEGFWAINNQLDTAKQYLEIGSQPVDNTSRLNDLEQGFGAADRFNIFDPGMESTHKACTLDYFKKNKFDIVIASIPAHIPLFENLIKQFNPEAKLIVQMGNEWPIDYWYHHNVLASVKARPLTTDINAIFYHQEVDLDIFWWDTVRPTKKIHSFVNVLSSFERASRDFEILEQVLHEYEFKSYGGQCRDGNMTGDRQLANKMREAEFILHVKDHGDGFGHVIHNAYAVGRPVITRSSDYVGKLAEDLLVDGTYLDIDKLGRNELIRQVRYFTDNPNELSKMGDRAAEHFRKVVNYQQEAEEIAQWLKTLK